MYFGLPGSLNEINVLDNITKMGKIVSKSFTSRMEYVKRVTRDLLYFLDDRIYPEYNVFVNTIADPGKST